MSRTEVNVRVCLNFFNSVWFGSYYQPCFSQHIFQNSKMNIQSVEIWRKFETSKQSRIHFFFFFLFCCKKWILLFSKD